MLHFKNSMLYDDTIVINANLCQWLLYVNSFVQSEGELKLNRIITLPSISENDEETDSDTNDLKNESPGSPDSNQEGSPTSPFLKKTFRFPVPNGDVLSR